VAEPDERPIDPQIVPVASWEVRRRRYGEQRWLVRHNQAFEVDPVVDLVWLACSEGLSVGEMAARVAETLDVTPAQATTATDTALHMLAEATFVVLDQG
jgi:hypothetical protein